MSSTVPALISLLKQSHIDDHEEVLKAANSAIKHSKNDLDAHHAKVVALLKLDRFDDATHAFEAGGEKLKEKARLEYAYTLYKTGKPSEAAEVARQGEQRGYKHVAAQASYRTEDFRRAAELYKDLAAQPEDDAEADLRINTGAVDAQLEWTDRGELVQKKKPGREDLEAFETAYNAACGSIARGELGQGEVLLKRARDLCNSLEDLGEAEKQAELLPITVQQVYVLARQGRMAQAGEMARSVDPRSIPDASTRHIAQVNSMAASEAPANPFLAQRLIAKGISSSEPDHPFRFQTSILNQNKHAVDLQSSKFGGTADATSQILAKQQSPNLDAYYNSVSVANAAAHAKSQTGKDALKQILPLLERRPNDIGLILTIVQLYVTTGNAASAITLMESFLARLEQSRNAAQAEARYAPGLVSAIVSLYHNAGRRSHARRELSKAAQYWRRKKGDERPVGGVHLLKAAGSTLLESEEDEHRQLATDIFTDLHKEDESDRYAAAGLLAASPETATKAQTASLQPVERLVASIDVDALESAGIAQPPSDAAAVTTRKRPADDTAKPAKPKRPRPSRLPKDYDPNKAPDPERWLPLKDRSTYRPKGKKGKVKQNLLSQGSAPALGGADSEGSRPGTPGAGVVQGKQPAGKGGRKKGKR
ncbi:Signal recognition particle subunit SRP72 [Elasticomyces elasticus]|nr:Signal recognition particle subunit SRP72 [Elasticomyces elasticus]